MMQQWFKDAKLGIFLHWGLYSVKGIPESWSFYNGQISYDDYMAQANGFTASKYDPQKWAEVFAKFGAKYTVLTAKHHDGFALWDTAYSDISAAKMSAAGRDLIDPYCKAMREAGMHVGLYFSHLDWSHPDNSAMIHPEWEVPCNPYTFSLPQPDYDRWARFLKFHRGQLRELMTRYGTIDLLWFDGDWEESAEQWDMKGLREYLHSMNPNVILNSRMQGYGDYETPEQGFPVSDPVGEAWEYCLTLNNSWGYNPDDHHHKPVGRLVRMFAEIISRGGNMLLDIGPCADGSLQPEQEKRLQEFGSWLHPVAEAVYATEKGIGVRHCSAPSTMSKDHKTLYLFAFGKPGELFIKGLHTPVKRAEILTTGQQLRVETMLGAPWNGVPPTVWITLPDELTDRYATVIRLELDGEVQLFEGAGGAIACN